MLDELQKKDAVQLWKKVFPTKTQLGNISEYSIAEALHNYEYDTINEYISAIASQYTGEIENTVPIHLHEFFPDQYEMVEKLNLKFYGQIVRLMHYIFNLDNASPYYRYYNIHAEVNNISSCDAEAH